MAAPLIAAGIMAGSSLLGAGIQAYSQYKAAEEERKAREDAAKRLLSQGQLTNSEYKEIIQSINDYYNNRQGLSKASDINDYRKAIADYNPEDYAADVGDFNNVYSKTKEDFINPYYSRIIGDTANTIQHSAAGAGLGRGTGAALNIAKGTAEKSDELYRTAMQDYQDDRDFAYQQFTDAIKNNQARLNAIRSGTEYKMGLQGNLAQDYVNTQDARQSDLLKAQQDRLASKQAYDTAMVGLY
jgi:hypothetical protein